VFKSKIFKNKIFKVLLGVTATLLVLSGVYVVLLPLHQEYSKSMIVIIKNGNKVSTLMGCSVELSGKTYLITVHPETDQ